MKFTVGEVELDETLVLESQVFALNSPTSYLEERTEIVHIHFDGRSLGERFPSPGMSIRPGGPCTRRQ